MHAAAMTTNFPRMTDADFKQIASLLESRAGIALGASKTDLVRSRLQGRIRCLGMENFSAYVKKLKNSADDNEEWQTFINLLTTNKTEFFRESSHFDYLTERFLPEWLKKPSSALRVWCCASSTG